MDVSKLKTQYQRHSNNSNEGSAGEQAHKFISGQAPVHIHTNSGKQHHWAEIAIHFAEVNGFFLSARQCPSVLHSLRCCVVRHRRRAFVGKVHRGVEEAPGPTSSR